MSQARTTEILEFIKTQNTATSEKETEKEALAIQTIVIEATETVSTEIDFTKHSVLAFQMPSVWTDATITIKGSATKGGTKLPISGDSEDSTFGPIAVAVDNIYAVVDNAVKMLGVPCLAFESSVAQEVERAITVMLK